MKLMMTGDGIDLLLNSQFAAILIVAGSAGTLFFGD